MVTNPFDQLIPIELPLMGTGAPVGGDTNLPGHPLRAKLRKRQDELTRLLEDIEIPGAEDLKKDWAEAAAAKRFAEEPVEMIVSPIESGSSGG
jgi:hypothetical protein